MSWTNRFSRESIPHNNGGSSIWRLRCCFEVSPSPGPWQPQIHYSFPFLECPVNEIIPDVVFCVWLLFFRIMLSRLVQVAACLSGSLFVAESLAWTCHHLLRSICSWTFGLFPSLVIMSKADTDIQGQSSVWT